MFTVEEIPFCLLNQKSGYLIDRMKPFVSYETSGHMDSKGEA